MEAPRSWRTARAVAAWQTGKRAGPTGPQVLVGAVPARDALARRPAPVPKLESCVGFYDCSVTIEDEVAPGWGGSVEIENKYKRSRRRRRRQRRRRQADDVHDARDVRRRHARRRAGDARTAEAHGEKARRPAPAASRGIGSTQTTLTAFFYDTLRPMCSRDGVGRGRRARYTSAAAPPTGARVRANHDVVY